MPALVTLEKTAPGLDACVFFLRSLQAAPKNAAACRVTLNIAANLFAQLLSDFGFHVPALQRVESSLNLPRARAPFVRRWFGDIKGFPQADTLASFVEHGVPVAVKPGSNITSALKYGNHRSVHPAEVADDVRTKIVDDIRLSRALVFPRELAHRIPGLRLSPLGAVVSPKKTRIIRDLSFDFHGSTTSVNEDTDFSSAPKVKLQHVLRNFVWRILYLRNRWPLSRILLSKMDVADAFRQVSVTWDNTTVFAYTFEDWVVIDRRLTFGWANSPGFFCMFSNALRHSHTHTAWPTTNPTPCGKESTKHVAVPPARPSGAPPPTPLPQAFRPPPGSGGDTGDEFFSEYYIDDALLAEVQHFVDGRRCLASSTALASDHHRLFGYRRAGDPPILATHKVSSWDTRLEVLGWTVDSESMTIGLSAEKWNELYTALKEWPPSRTFAPEREVQSLLGKLLHACYVFRPGKFMVRRILNILHMPQISEGRKHTQVAGRQRLRPRIPLVPEFHSDIAFWNLMITEGLQRGADALAAPLHSFYLQDPFRSLFSDASGRAIGGFCPETGSWWRFDLDVDHHRRLSDARDVAPRDQLSINLLELLGMAINAAMFLVAGNQPRYYRDSLLLRGDNSAAVTWINKCRAKREPRAGALMRILGCLEMGSDWCFTARHVAGVANDIADGISRWEPRSSVPTNLSRLYPNVAWHEQVLPQRQLDLCSGVLDSSTSEAQLRNRLDALMGLPSVLGSFFANRSEPTSL